MKTNHCLAAAAFFSCCALSPALFAQTPPWWTTRTVIDTSKSAADYAAANQGQAKAIAAKAYAELQERIPGGAGASLSQLILGWSTLADPKDYSTINIGQLKYISKLFYDRLAEAGYHGNPLASGQTYPWTTTTADDADYAAANIGQVKTLFSFHLGGSSTDADSDGLPDWWETWHFGNTTSQNGSGDPDGDSRSNATEYSQGTSPANADVTVPTSPTLSVTASTTPTSVGLRWSGAADTGSGTTGILGYDIYRGGVKVGVSTNGTFIDTGLTAGTSYSYSIKTIDRAGNLAASPPTWSIATPASSSSGTFEVFTPTP